MRWSLPVDSLDHAYVRCCSGPLLHQISPVMLGMRISALIRRHNTVNDTAEPHIGWIIHSPGPIDEYFSQCIYVYKNKYRYQKIM